MRGVLIAAGLATLSAAAHAQPPAEENAIPPDQVCLTNACSTAPRPVDQLKTVRDAIAAGQAFRVRDLGGTPRDAMDAIMQRQADRKAGLPADQREMIEELEANLRAFADISDGSTLRFTNNTDFQSSSPLTVVGSIERRGPDGSIQNFWLTDNGGGIWVRPGYEPPPRG